MKRIFILLAAVAVVAAGCKNYDDRFDDLNSQIGALNTQVTALQGVASQVTAIDTEIKNIRQSIQGDIQTAVAGVSTTLGNNLQTAQTALNAEITKLQTALNQAAANSLSQEDIDQLKADLAAAQKTALDTAVKGLQDKVTALETALAEAAKNNLSQADIDQLKADLAKTQKEALDKALEGLQTKLAEIETAIEDGDAVPSELTEQLEDIKEALDESISRAGFYTETVDITTNGKWKFFAERLPNVQEFSGDFIINTEKLSNENIDALIAWVAKIQLITADLTITHDDDAEDKVIKFAALTTVETLNDGQPHAHYPELTSVDTIHLNSEDKNNDNEFVTETVKFPKLEQTVFAGNKIHLPEAEELDLSALLEYESNLDIELDGGKLDLSSLQEIHNGERSERAQSLTITDVDEVHLEALTKVEELTVEDVETLKAPKITDGDLTINENVEKVDVATAEGAHIEKLTLGDGSKEDIEELKIGGDEKKTELVIQEAGNQLEVVHIHGAKKVSLHGAGGLDELVTARTIVEFTLNASGLNGDLVLGHQSGPKSVLEILYNEDITSLTADKVNELKVLGIKGNHDLEKISFAALKKGSAQSFGKPNWKDGDAVVIGGTQYDNSESGADGNYLAKDRNNLKADVIHLAVSGNGPNAQDGEISDASGIAALEDFLKHATIRRAVVSYDGVESFRRTGLDSEKAEEIESNRDGTDLILVRKGLKGAVTSSGQAKRVFLVDTSGNGFPSADAVDLQIGVNGLEDFSDFHRDIDLSVGGSVNNHVDKINDAEIKKFFDTNNVIVHAEAGGHPKGSLTFSVGTGPANVGDGTSTNDPVGSLKLTIGNTRTGVYSHEVILQVVDNDNPLKEDVAFSATEKNAKTYINADNNTNDGDNHGYSSLNDLADILISAFPRFSGTEPAAYPVRPGAEHVPFGISGRAGVTLEGDNRDNTVIVGLLDAQKISEKQIDVKVVNNLKATSADDADDVAFFGVKGGFGGNRITQKNIKNDPNTIQITLTSKIAGVDESTIGAPTDDVGNTRPDVATDYILPNSDIATTPGAYVYRGTATGDNSKELPIAKANPRKSSLPKAGTDQTDTGEGDKDLNRLGWL